MKVFGEEVSNRDAWKLYCIYLIQWAKDHQEPEFCGMCPASFDEWADNEYEEEE